MFTYDSTLLAKIWKLPLFPVNMAGVGTRTTLVVDDVRLDARSPSKASIRFNNRRIRDLVLFFFKGVFKGVGLGFVLGVVGLGDGANCDGLLPYY